MADKIDITVPDLGDFTDVEVIEILVSADAAVEQEDGLITLETDKASMDVPAPAAGNIVAITVAVGDKVSAGDVIGQMEVAGGSETAPATDESATDAASADEKTVVAETVDVPAVESGPETVNVPDIGDFSDVDVIEVHVSVGDVVAVDDPLVTLETDKAAMDVPSTHAGTITAVAVSVGDTVSEGSAIATLDAVAGLAEATAADAKAEAPAKAPPAAAPSPPPPVQAPAPKAQASGGLPPIDESGFSLAHASPSVRKLARGLGVNLAQVQGTGDKKRVLHDDVKAFVKSVMTGGAPTSGAAALPATPVVDFAKFGAVDEQPLTRIQKISGPRLQASWINLPHVTQHDLADITELEARRQELKGPAKERGIGLTPLAFIMKAVIAALKEFPKVNASLSADENSLVYKEYYHLGFAADTENGLMVPVIHDADRMDVYELATELGTLSLAAREGKLKANQMQGASFTISSLGGIGGIAFTPIVNAPEVAILGVSRSSMQPVWNGSEFEPRLMLPLSFSYDHRVIDGAYAVRFTTFLAQTLTDVDKLLQAIP
ncbi:MAG: dihydrolipoyllysine-residue acetyltransferase [Pseudomonadota bacterium]